VLDFIPWGENRVRFSVKKKNLNRPINVGFVGLTLNSKARTGHDFPSQKACTRGLNRVCFSVKNISNAEHRRFSQLDLIPWSYNQAKCSVKNM
jgi:hypothetical protein